MYLVDISAVVGVKIFRVRIESEHALHRKIERLADPRLAFIFDVEDSDTAGFVLAQQNEVGSLQQKQDVDYSFFALEILYGVTAHVILPDVNDAHESCDVTLITPGGVDDVVLRIERLEATESSNNILSAGTLKHLLSLGEQVIYNDVFTADVSQL